MDTFQRAGRRRAFVRLAAAGVVLTVAGRGLAVQAAPLSAPDLGAALRKGGYVLVMRHTSSPAARPQPAAADPGNPALERQLDAPGRAAAAAIGRAVKAAGLPVGEVLSSPTFRALETVRLAGFGAPKTAAELGDGGQSMAAVSGDPAAWLRRAAATPPRAGTDTMIVTHQPNIAAAFAVSDAGDGETLVFHPDGHGQVELAARVKPGDWASLQPRR